MHAGVVSLIFAGGLIIGTGYLAPVWSVMPRCRAQCHSGTRQRSSGRNEVDLYAPRPHGAGGSPPEALGGSSGIDSGPRRNETDRNKDVSFPHTSCVVSIDHNAQVPHYDLQSAASARDQISGKYTESTSAKGGICGIPPKRVDCAQSLGYSEKRDTFLTNSY